MRNLSIVEVYNFNVPDKHQFRARLDTGHICFATTIHIYLGIELPGILIE